MGGLRALRALGYLLEAAEAVAVNLGVRTGPVPVPGPGEALLAVSAAAITLAELTWGLSWTTRGGRDRTPVIPSHEVSAMVAGLGPDAGGPRSATRSTR